MGDATREKAADRARYPRQSDVTRAIRVARDNGVRVSSIELARDGTIRLSDDSSKPAETLFDALDKANRL